MIIFSIWSSNTSIAEEFNLQKRLKKKIQNFKKPVVQRAPLNIKIT